MRNFGNFSPVPKYDFEIKPKGLDVIYPKSENKKRLETVAVPEKPQVDTSLNPFEWLQAIFYKTKTEGERKMFDAIKTFLLPKIIQWIMKGAGSVLVYIGITKQNPSIEEIIAGILSFGVSAVWSLISTGKIALTDPKDILKIK